MKVFARNFNSHHLKMIDLTRLLPKLLRTNGAGAELAVKLAWARAAGAGLRRHAAVVRLDDRTLIVAVADAIWKKQLEHMSSELIFRVNNLLGQSLIDSLVFRVDGSALSQVDDPADSPKKPSRPPAPTELLFAARSISEPELRERFIRAAENCIARREARAANLPRED